MVPFAKPEDSHSPPPSSSFLRKIESLAIDKLGAALDIPHKPISERAAQRTTVQEARLREIEANAIANYQGDLTQLEAALGMLRLGDHLGWKALYMIHTKKTIRLYEEILDIRVRDLFEETGPSAYRSIGLNLAQRFSNFWKVAGGEIKIPRRRDTIR